MGSGDVRLEAVRFAWPGLRYENMLEGAMVDMDHWARGRYALLLWTCSSGLPPADAGRKEDQAASRRGHAPKDTITGRRGIDGAQSRLSGGVGQKVGDAIPASHNFGRARGLKSRDGSSRAIGNVSMSYDSVRVSWAIEGGWMAKVRVGGRGFRSCRCGPLLLRLPSPGFMHIDRVQSAYTSLRRQCATSCDPPRLHLPGFTLVDALILRLSIHSLNTRNACTYGGANSQD
jgi:hypothetical protein